MTFTSSINLAAAHLGIDTLGVEFCKISSPVVRFLLHTLCVLYTCAALWRTLSEPSMIPV